MSRIGPFGAGFVAGVAVTIGIAVNARGRATAGNNLTVVVALSTLSPIAREAL